MIRNNLKFSKKIQQFWYYVNRQNSRNFSIRQLSIIENDNHQIPETIRNKIIYSSVLEKFQLRIGYKRRKIIENIIEKQKYKERIDNLNNRPFPIVLESLGYDINLKSSSEIEKEEEPQEKEELTPAEKVLLTKQILSQNEFPTNWLEDYEYFDENITTDDDENIGKFNGGTANPKIPASQIPCNGCGANLHCADAAIPGYIPSEIFIGRNKKQLQTIICQRCHFLKNYNIALDVLVSPEDYLNTLSQIKDKHALALLIVDLLDFPCSIWPEIENILGSKRPVIIVGNKVDLLPKDSKGYLDHIKNCLRQSVKNSFGLSKINVKQICLVSAKTGFGIEELITQLHNIWSHRGDVYLVGCANVGKSSIFNSLLRSDYCKVEASDLVKRATTCPWPGTTLQMLKFPILRPSDIRIYHRCRRLMSERTLRQAEEQLRRDQLKQSGKIEHATLMGHIGMTFKQPEEVEDIFSMPKGSNPILSLDENSKDYKNSKWCYDTPGVINREQIYNLLTTEELLLVNPTQMISPRAFRIKQNMTLFLAGLGRLDFIGGNLEFVKLMVYSSHQLPILITNTADADELYENLLGTELLSVPRGDKNRLSRWPKLETPGPIEIKADTEESNETCDILLSSAGWIGVNLDYGKNCLFKAWTPEKRGIMLRQPSLIRYGNNLIGNKIRGSVAYKIGKPFIKQ